MKEFLKKDNYNNSALISGLNMEGFELARVIAEHRGLYRVKTSVREYDAKVTGKQMFVASTREDYPAVGDHVAVEIIDDHSAIIKSLMPRKTIIRKKRGNEIQIIAANVDVAFIVESVDRDYNLNRLERYCTLCLESNIKPVVVVSKTDLISHDELKGKIEEVGKRLRNVDIIATSISKKEGLGELKNFIKSGITYCFLGSSGVGKSTLINNLIGRKVAETGAIGEHAGRGKHTTTHREMFFLDNGGILIDNPGMREVGLADFESGVEQVFDDIATLATQCRFSDCAHISEPGCAVLKALQDGRLDADQYENYLSLKKEVDFYEMSDFEKKDKERKFGRHIKKSLKKLDEIERCR